MTLEDLFTLTEMKDGLTSHTRVEELISMMQKDKDSVVKNIPEAARQWSTVATTLTATENQDNLDHFIRLDGLLFLEQYLEEARNFTNDTSDNTVEESISLLLGALKKLPIDFKSSSVSSGIGETVKKLFVHKSSMVQETAKALFDDRVKQSDDTVVAVESLSSSPKHSHDEPLTEEENTDGKPMEGEEDGFRENSGDPLLMSNEEPSKSRDSTTDAVDERNGSVEETGEEKETSCNSASAVPESDNNTEKKPESDNCTVADEVEATDTDTEELVGESVLKMEEVKISDTNENSDMELYGLDDALDIARLVAKEVEREVVDYREDFCSSSDKNSDEVPQQPGSPDSINSEEDKAGSEKIVDCTPEEVQKPPDESKKGCDIDLNELFSEQIDEHQDQDQPTVTFVSASKVAPSASMVPRAPVRFEGELGWKGSAATSAFRPTSARPTPDKSIETTSRGFLDFDLNVADTESSVEVSSTRAQRLKLDLNLLGDNDDTPSPDFRMEERLRHRCQSPASSSSSKQFPMRNIDLNGNPNPNPNPNLFEDSSDHRIKREIQAPMVSILGARVAVNRPEFVPQTRSFLPNGSVFGSHHHPFAYATPPPVQPAPFYAYNGFNTGPYGSPMMPQMMASSSDAPPSHPSQPQFLMPFMGLNGVTRPGFDLNSGLAVMEAESRENGGLRQLFIPGPGLSGPHPHPHPHPLGQKRKEPDNGWDFYPIGYKQHPPWH